LLCTKYTLTFDPNVLLDCWCLLDGNPAAYTWLFTLPPEDVLKDFNIRQTRLVNYLLTTGLSSAIPSGDLLAPIQRNGIPSSSWTAEQQERLQKLVDREVVVRKSPFKEFLKNRLKSKKDHVAFANYHPIVAIDADAKRYSIKSSAEGCGNFMKTHRGYALEDAFKSFYIWFSSKLVTESPPGLSSGTDWTVLEQVSFHGVNSDADLAMMNTTDSVALFYIKTQAADLVEEEGIRKFLKAFNEIAELKPFEVHLVLGCLTGTISNVSTIWTRLCSEYKEVSFKPPTDPIYLLPLLSKYMLCVSTDLKVDRPILFRDMEDAKMSNQIVRIQGCRQVGKTTFIKKYFLGDDYNKYTDL